MTDVKNETPLPDVVGILPLRGLVIFPQAVVPLSAGRPSSVRLIEEVMQSGRILGAVMQRDPRQDTPRIEDLARVGTLVVVHKALKQSDGTFRVEPNQPLRYVEAGGGRVMTENSPGEITTTRTGLLVGNLLLNLAHFLAWFACFWLLLRFQWSHALGLAVVFWLVFAVVAWPVLKERVRRAVALARSSRLPVNRMDSSS